MLSNALWKRVLAYVVSTGMIIGQVPYVGAAPSVFGTVRGAGPAWVGADSSEWSQVSSTRPLLAGDSLKTGDKGFVLAELGHQGTVGMYSGAEVRTSGTSDAAVIDVTKGKVAFHVGDNSALQLASAGAAVKGSGKADGYIDGGHSLTVERGVMQVAMSGGEHTVKAGQRFHFDTQTVEPVKVAGAYGEPQQVEEIPSAPPPPPAEQQETTTSTGKRNLVAAWVVGGLALAGIITAVAVTASDGGGSDSSDYDAD